MNVKKPDSPAREPIRVKTLWFSGPNGMQIPIPGRHGGNTSQLHMLVAGKVDGVDICISYHAWMRCHRVSYQRPGMDSPRSFYVPESWCSWEASE